MELLGLSIQSLTGALLIMSTLIYCGGLAVLFTRAEFGTLLQTPVEGWMEIVVSHVPAWQWGWSTLAIGVVMTVLGLALFTVLLGGIGELILAALALVAFSLGAVLWVIDMAVHLSLTVWAAKKSAGGATIPTLYVAIVEWGETLLKLFTVLALLSIAAFGWAILRTGLLPGWIGWISIIWSLFWLIHLFITKTTIPIVHHVMPLVIGIALLVEG